MRRALIRGRTAVLTLALLFPMAAGADCSSNAVGQAAATTAANVAITQAVTLFFEQLATQLGEADGN